MHEAPFTLKHLKDRCKECGDCWEWGSAYREGKYPVISSRRDWDGSGASSNRQFYVRHLTYWHKHGKPPYLNRSRCMSDTCGNPRCVNPDHLEVVTRKKRARRTVDEGKLSSLAKARNVAQARRRNSKLTDAQIAEIRASDENAKLLAARYGCTYQYIYMLRNNQWRKDYSNPFAGLFAANDSNRRAA